MISQQLSMIMRLFWRSLKAVPAKDLNIIAGYVGFTAFIALFPFMVFLVALAGFLGTPETAQVAVQYTFEYFPGEVANVIKPIVEGVINNTPTGLLTFAMIGALWASSSGIEGLRSGLNVIYHVSHQRPMWKKRLQSLFIVLCTAVVFLVGAFLIILAPLALTYVQDHIVDLSNVVWMIDLIRYSFAIFSVSLSIAVLQYFLPNHDEPFRNMLPGAFLTTILWIGCASLFSLYLENFGNYNAVYGTLGGIIIALLFFYISALLVLIGGEFNHQLTRHGIQTPA